MQRDLPIGAAQRQVLTALGLTANGYGEANAIFAKLGLSVGSKRVGRASEPVISLVDNDGGAFNAYGEGETWSGDVRSVDLTPLLAWIIERDQAEAQRRIAKAQAATAPAAPAPVMDLGPITGHALQQMLAERPPFNVWFRDEDGNDYSGIDAPEMTCWRDDESLVTDGYQRPLHLVRQV